MSRRLSAPRLQTLALDLLDWHGGQGSALYSVGSRLLTAARARTEFKPEPSTARAAARELLECDAPDELRGRLGAWILVYSKP